MSECILNIYKFHVAPVGERKGIEFKHASLNSIKVVDDELMRLQNRVSDVSIKRGDSWVVTSQALFLRDLTKDVDKGIFYGRAEVGSHTSFDHVRKRSGIEPYALQDDDYTMREYFYRIEMPPDSSLGFLVVQRHGRNTATNAIQQALRQKFFSSDYTMSFRLVTDSMAFSEYLHGRVQGVKATYIPRTKESRKSVKRAVVFGSRLSSKSKEDMDINLKVSRHIDAQLRKQIEEWLTSDEGQAPQIVTLPVSDDPDKIVLQIETDSGQQKKLHPGMIEDMALTVDLTSKVKWNSGHIDLSSANDAVAELCAAHRAKLVTAS